MGSDVPIYSATGSDVSIYSARARTEYVNGLSALGLSHPQPRTASTPRPSESKYVSRPPPHGGAAVCNPSSASHTHGPLATVSVAVHCVAPGRVFSATVNVDAPRTSRSGSAELAQPMRHLYAASLEGSTCEGLRTMRCCALTYI